jgi:CRP-like cAMP-binding protein
MKYDEQTGDVYLDVFANAPERQLQPGETLIHAGDTAKQVFNILDGCLMVSRVGKDGRRQVMSFLFRDNFVGLTATDKYFFTVQAVTPSTVAWRSRAVLEDYLAGDPTAEITFRNMVFRVLENSLDLVYSLGQRTAIERLSVFLLYLRRQYKISGATLTNPNLVPLPMSGPQKGNGQQELLRARKSPADQSPGFPQRIAKKPRSAARACRHHGFLIALAACRTTP